MLRGDFGRVQSVDVTGVERLDSAGVLQLLRFARRQGIDYGVFAFREDHLALVAAIEDVADERPRKRRGYGFQAELGRGPCGGRVCAYGWRSGGAVCVKK